MDQKRRRPLWRRDMEPRNITQGVGALIYAKDTKRYLFLLRQGRSWSMTWALPGGRAEVNERMDKALAREIQEELGGTIPDAELILIERFVSTNGKFVYYTYFISVDYEFVPVLNHEHIGYAWLPIEHAPKPLHPGLARSFASRSVTSKLNSVCAK